MHAYADDKRRRKQLDLIIANLAQTAIGADDNEVTLIDDTGSQTLPRAAKTAIASQLISHIAERYLRQKR